MRKPPSKMRLQDLRPNTTIDCLRCGQPKASAGSMRFHAHWVCVDCAKKLNQLQEKKDA